MQALQAFEIHHDIPEADYHQRAGCSASQLRTLLTKSAAHLQHQRRHPQEETAALRVGRLLHCMVLTPGLVKANFTIAPDINRRTNAGKEEWERFIAANSSKTVVTNEEWGDAHGMAQAAQSTGLFSKGQPEISIFGSMNGVDVKSRIDWFNAGEIIDVKSTSSVASPREFQRTVWNWGYGLQAAFYMRMARAAGLSPSKFVFVAVEKEAPHVVGVYDLDPTVIELFDRQIDDLIEEYKQSLVVDVARSWGRHTISIPTWAKAGLEDEA